MDIIIFWIFILIVVLLSINLINEISKQKILQEISNNREKEVKRLETYNKLLEEALLEQYCRSQDKIENIMEESND